MARFASYKGIPVNTLLEEGEMDEIVHNTMVGGATLTGLLGTSAWMAPGASVATLVDSIINNQMRMIPCSAYLEGEYGCNDIFIGVPCLIGKNGIEGILELELNDKEKELFAASYAAVAKTTGILKEINAI